MSALLWQLDPEGENLSAASMMAGVGREKLTRYIPDWDKHGASSSIYRGLATNIYQLKDGRYFHLHGMSLPRWEITSRLGSLLLLGS